MKAYSYVCLTFQKLKSSLEVQYLHSRRHCLLGSKGAQKPYKKILSSKQRGDREHGV